MTKPAPFLMIGLALFSAPKVDAQTKDWAPDRILMTKIWMEEEGCFTDFHQDLDGKYSFHLRKNVICYQKKIGAEPTGQLTEQQQAELAARYGSDPEEVLAARRTAGICARSFEDALSEIENGFSTLSDFAAVLEHCPPSRKEELRQFARTADLRSKVLDDSWGILAKAYAALAATGEKDLFDRYVAILEEGRAEGDANAIWQLSKLYSDDHIGAQLPSSDVDPAYFGRFDSLDTYLDLLGEGVALGDPRALIAKVNLIPEVEDAFQLLDQAFPKVMEAYGERIIAQQRWGESQGELSDAIKSLAYELAQALGDETRSKEVGLRYDPVRANQLYQTVLGLPGSSKPHYELFEQYAFGTGTAVDHGRAIELALEAINSGSGLHFAPDVEFYRSVPKPIVEGMQIRLKADGYYGGVVDGLPGPQFYRAICQALDVADAKNRISVDLSEFGLGTLRREYVVHDEYCRRYR